MENFFGLRAEKQSRIIDGALAVFGRNTYKNAPTGDIAAEAGISKSMIFYYFGSKKNLYLFLVELCGNTVIAEFEKNAAGSPKDFFDRIKMMTDAKLSVMKKHPDLLSFLKNVYSETDEDVADDIRKYMKKNEAIREKWLLLEADVSRFKDPAAPKLLEKFLIWAGEGCLSDIRLNDSDSLDALMEEFNECLSVLKHNFYKD